MVAGVVAQSFGAVASDTRGPRFESSHRQTYTAQLCFTNICLQQLRSSKVKTKKGWKRWKKIDRGKRKEIFFFWLFFTFQYPTKMVKNATKNNPVYCKSFSPTTKLIIGLGGSPGLVVMGGDSHSKGHGFESWRQILDGHDIFHIDLL